MKTRIILLALFCSTIAHAQSVIDQVFRTIVPETERAYSIQMIKTDKSLANRREVARYDVNGIKLTCPQKGVNIILYSDGTTNKVIEK